MEQTPAKTRGETRKAEIGNWKIENRNSKMASDTQQAVTGGTRVPRNWKAEIGNWEIETRNWKIENSLTRPTGCS
jgi:hypothetical protein